MSRFLSSARAVGFTAILICGNATADHSLAFGQEPDPTVIVVTGTERLGWDQSATSAIDLATISFIIYVDDVPFDVESADCNSRPPTLVFRCSSPLPPLTPGRHVVDVAALRNSIEFASPRSTPINLLVMPSGAGAVAGKTRASTFITGDGIRLSASVVATGIEDATDLALIGRGRIAIAERGGRIRLYEPGTSSLSVAATLPDLDASAPGSGLLTIAANGKFDPEGAVYVVYTTATGGRLARFAADDRGFTARATLLDGLPLSRSHPHASLRIGPDQKLYLGLDDGGIASSVGDLGSLSGKVLRLNLDGTTPVDAVGRLYAGGLNHPTSMTWSASPSLFWLSGLDAAGIEDLQQKAVTASTTNKDAARRYSFPLSMGESAMVLYRGDKRSTLNGNLLIAGSRARSILRVQISATGSIEKTEWLFDSLFVDVRAMVIDDTGAIYACSGNSLIRIAVQD